MNVTPQQHVVAGANAHLTVQISTPSGPYHVVDGSNRYVEMTVRDAVSGQAVVSFQMDAGTFFDHLLSSGERTIEGWLVPDDLRHRLGHEVEHESFKIPDEATVGWSYDHQTREKRAMEWAKEQPWWDEWETHHVTFHNWGMAIRCLRYIKPAPFTPATPTDEI